MHQRRVVITGLGVLAPNGCGKETFWQACIQGRSGIRPITRFSTDDFSTRIAGNVPDFAPEAFGLTPDECTRLGRTGQFAVAAANLALEDAGFSSAHLRDSERERMGVYIGSAMTSIEEAEKAWLQFAGKGTSSSQARSKELMLAVALRSYMPSALVAAHHSLQGPCLTLSTACSAGGDAVGQAFWQIQEGRADRMLAGGADSALTPMGLGVFSVMHALSTHNDEPERASRPYEARRDGFVL